MTALPTAGTVLDQRYVIQREIARGAAGIVYAAEHRYTKRPVALKVLGLATRHDAESRRRLLGEAEALNRVRHPAIVEVLDAGELEPLGPYLVTELLAGRTLQGILTARRRLGIEETIAIGRTLAEALAHAHARGVIHRDLKPGNVFVLRDESGREGVKLFDFGVARVVPSGERVTLPGALIGTPEYMAPEQLLAQDPIDHRADVYALGVTLYECLTGSVPFEGSFGEVLLKSSTQPMPPVRSVNPDVPEALARVVERALARDPDARFADMHAFGRALSAARASTPDRPPTSGPAGILSSTVGAGQRRHPRAPYVTPVRVLFPSGATLDGRSEDISLGGLLAILAGSCAAGDRVRVRFAVPITHRIAEIEATTRWVRTARGREAVGLEFGKLPRDVRDAIERYVRAMGAE